MTEVATPKNGKRPESMGDDDLPADFYEWPTATQASSDIGISVRSLMRLVERGVIRCLRGPDGVKHFDPALIQDYKLSRTSFGGDVESDDDERMTFERRNEDRRDKQLNAAVRRLDASNELVDILLTGIQRFVNIVAAPAERMLDKHDRFSTRIIERNEYLETLAFKMLKNQEESLTEREVRELAKSMHLASEERKSEAFKLIMSRAPRFLDQVEATLLDKHPEAKVQVMAAIELLTSPEITPEMLEVIKSVLSPENQARVDKIIDPDGKKRAAAAAKKAADEKTTAADTKASASAAGGSADAQSQQTDKPNEKETTP